MIGENIYFVCGGRIQACKRRIMSAEGHTLKQRQRRATREVPLSQVESLVVRFARTRDAKLREKVIESQIGLVEALAAKFARPGAQMEDLVQVGTVGLIQALDRFNPELGVKFSTYAVSTIVGEIKHYFRDCTWLVKAPRHLREIASSLPRVEEKMGASLGRPPALAELADYYRVSEETLLQAMDLDQVYSPYSLDAELGSETSEYQERLQNFLGHNDPQIEALVEHAPLRTALARLSTRKQWILRRRYFEGWSQVEVSEALGISQMHVSRLERDALRDLRRSLEVPPGAFAR
jgi:RNA polymerase sigma-B factor